MAADEKPRRDFLFLATGAVAALGGIALTKPLLGHMAPAADVLASPEISPTLKVELSLIEEGKQFLVSFRGRPIGIRHRTQPEVKAAKAGNSAELKDPETDQSRIRPKLDGTFDPRYIVVDLVCPRFGCVVIGETGDFDGWFCPCGGEHYDTSGRARKGPSNRNLRVPKYRWTSETSITLLELTP